MRISYWSSDVCSSDLIVAASLIPLEVWTYGAARRDLGDGSRRTTNLGRNVVDEPHPWAGAAVAHSGGAGDRRPLQLGRASCRERVCRSVSSSVGGGS